jgi:hypothetical protein
MGQASRIHACLAGAGLRLPQDQTPSRDRTNTSLGPDHLMSQALERCREGARVEFKRGHWVKRRMMVVDLSEHRTQGPGYSREVRVLWHPQAVAANLPHFQTAERLSAKENPQKG